MFEAGRVAVIGCGVFGAVIAIGLAEAGADVTVFERQQDILQGASQNNQRRLHQGFHYPRDLATARQCVRGFSRFRDAFPDCVSGGWPNAYFIASEGSKTAPEDYRLFAERLGVEFTTIDVATFEPEVRGVSAGILVPEAVYDCSILRETLRGRLDRAGVHLLLGHDVVRIERERGGFRLNGEQVFDAVVNCAYADINRLGAQLGHPCPRRQYEYTVVPIVEWDRPPVGITVMDGPFATVLPLGKTGRFLVYHVVHSVVDRALAEQVPEEWLVRVRHEVHEVGERILSASEVFVPDLARARIVGFLEGPRVVLPDSEDTDARPSIVRAVEPGYLTVFAGKVDHCVAVADEVVSRLMTPARTS